MFASWHIYRAYAHTHTHTTVPVKSDMHMVKKDQGCNEYKQLRAEQLETSQPMKTSYCLRQVKKNTTTPPSTRTMPVLLRSCFESESMQNWQKLCGGKKECSFPQGKVFPTTSRSLARADGIIAAWKVPTETELLLPSEASTGYKLKCQGQEWKMSSKGE